MAEILGDPTARNMGRLTLNPLKHLDPFGSFILPLIMIMVAGIGLGYAKPVPIDPRYFKNPQKGMALTAVAGPLANFSMATIAGIIFKLGIIQGPANNSVAILKYTQAVNAPILGKMLLLFILVNIFLGSFNLLPMPPLDGSKIVAGFLPKSTLYTYYRLERYGMLILLVLLILFRDILGFIFINIILPLAGFFI